jgi:hypothetical protein
VLFRRQPFLREGRVRGVRIARGGRERIGLDEQRVGEEPESPSRVFHRCSRPGVAPFGVRPDLGVRIDAGGARLGEKLRQSE